MPNSPLPSGRRLPACAFADIGEPDVGEGASGQPAAGRKRGVGH
ncbi:hypothetical protein ACV357_33945, partial [Pseudomonas aeruginosa]